MGGSSLRRLGATGLLFACACGGSTAASSAPDGGGDVAATSCSPGAACTPIGNPCQTGTTSCASGSAECVGTSDVPPGTACGTNQVCNDGACTACAQGASCLPGGNACLTGVTSCSTGLPSCMAVGNVPDGAPCDASGAGGVCFDGACTACIAGTPCQADDNVCETGTTSCATGQLTCVRTGNAVDGTPCGADGGTGQVCAGGLCGSCQAGTSCSPGDPPDLCQTGSVTCIDGQAMCASTGNAPDGTVCGTNGVCLAGACTLCIAGSACAPGGNPCATGVMSCGTGQPTCVSTGQEADATLCGASGICCAGSCAACATTTGASLACNGNHMCSVACDVGLTLCGNSCVDTLDDDSACGSTCAVCVGGTTCINALCSSEYGHPTAFSPCNATNGSIQAGILVAQAVTLAAGTVEDLGVVSTQSGVITMALYSSTATGTPLSPVTQTSTTSITAGSNVIFTTPVAVSNGTYWIAAELQASTVVCADGASTAAIDFGSEPYGTFPASWVPASTVKGGDYNFFVVVH